MIKNAFRQPSPAISADTSQPPQTAKQAFDLKVVPPLLLEWKDYAKVSGNRSDGKVKVSNGTEDDFDLTFVVLAVAGFVTPLVAALAMSGSSLLVTLNALRASRLGIFAISPKNAKEYQPAGGGGTAVQLEAIP